jgi:serine/threonine protein phosphatase PrpC
MGGQRARSIAHPQVEIHQGELVNALGTPFIVFCDNVLDELNVSDEQKEKLLKHVMEQIMKLQRERAFVLNQDELVKELRITDQQRRQIVTITQELQKKIQPLIKEAQSGGNREEIRPKVFKIRDEYVEKLEAVLTDFRQKKWKDMLGEPFDLGD